MRIEIFELKGRGGESLVVRMHVFYSNDASLNPAEVWIFSCKKVVKKNKNQ